MIQALAGEFVAQSAQEEARCEMEQRLLGWQLAGAPGVLETVAEGFRSEAIAFLAPYDLVQSAIFREYDAQHIITVRTVYAALESNPGIAKVGGIDHLQTLAFAAPAVTSAADGRKQALQVIRTWRAKRSPVPQPGDVELLCADSITPTKVDWIWDGWLAAGKFHLIAGSPSTGKTTIAMSLAAIISKGANFPDGSKASIGSVLVWSGEDDASDSLVPRFMASGGDRKRLHFVGGVRGENGETFPFDPATDAASLITAARAIGDLRLLVLDPVVSAVAGDSHKNSEVRRALQPLVDFASQARVAVLGITHFSKNTSGRDSVERVTGSGAFTALARGVMVTGKPKDGESWRLIRSKSNLGPSGGGFDYGLERVPVDEAGDIQGQRVSWGDPVEGTAEALLAEVETPEGESDPSTREAAEAWLVDKLRSNGEARATYLQETAKREGHSWATVRRAKKDLGIVSRNDGKEGWWWCWDNMLTSCSGAHHKNSEHVSTCSTVEHVSTCSDAHLNGVGACLEQVSTLSSEVVQ